MITVMLLLAVAAFLCAIAAAMGRVPLYVAVLLLSLFALLQVIPLGG